MNRSFKEDETKPAGDIIIVVVLPSFAASLAENAFHTLHNNVLWTTAVGPRALVWGPYIACLLLLSWIPIFAKRFGRDGLLACAAGWTLSLAVIHLFRGAVNWPGVFDLAERSKLHLIMPLLIPAFVGLALSYMIQMHDDRFSSILPWALIVIAIGWSLFHFVVEPGLSSQFPYTRPVALGALTVILLFAKLLDRFQLLEAA